jgi:hypothetical protein
MKTTIMMKMTAFWNMTPVVSYQTDVSEALTAFITKERVTALMMEAVRSFETSVC